MTLEKLVIELEATGFERLQGQLLRLQTSMRTLFSTQKKGIGLFSKQIEGIGRTKKMFASMSKTNTNAAQSTQAVQNSLQDLFSGVTPQTATFGSVMRMSNEEFGSFNKNGRKFQTTGGRMANKLRMATAGLKGFRMEMLGVMFFGMAMARMFSSMLRPATEATGMFEIWGTVLEVVFLPVMLALLPLFLSISEALIEMGPGAQMAVGIFAILGMIVGKVLFLVGTLALGIGSLMQAGAFGAMSGFFQTILTFLGGLGAAAAIVFAVVTAIIIGAVLAWQTNFGNFRDWVGVLWQSIKDIFVGYFKIFGGIIKVFTALFKGDMEGVKEGFKQIWEGIKQFVVGVFKFVVSLLVTLGLAILKFITWILNGLWNMITTIVQLGVELGTKLANAMWDAMPSWLQKLINGVMNITGKIVGSVFGTGDGAKKENDFIMRPGQQSVSMNPNDTIVGFKGDSPFGGGATVNQTLNITVSDPEEMFRLIRGENDSLVRKLQRNT